VKRLIIILIIALLSVQFADAQRKKSTMFDDSRDAFGWQEGEFYIGPVLGAGWWGAIIGADGEFAITDKKWMAFGAGGTIAYHTGYSSNYGSWYDLNKGWQEYSIHYFPITIQAFASWHLFPHKKFDVFARLGFGYNIWMTTTTGNAPLGWSDWAHSSGFGINEQVGIRWYLSKTFALRAVVGDPITLGVGCDFIIGD